MIFFPLVQSDINWKQLFLFMKEVLEVDILQDKTVSERFPTFIYNIDGILNEDFDEKDPAKILECGLKSIRHLSFAFLFSSTNQLFCKDLLDNGISANLTTFGEKNGQFFYIISGTLSDWRSWIGNCCGEYISYELRLLLNNILLYFDFLFIGRLWSEYQRLQLDDGTFILV